VALMPVAEALSRVLADTEPLAAESTPLTEAHGRVLAADVAALRTQPPADVSAMDGYAVRSADVARVPAKLKLVLPGADAIVIQENAVRDGDAVIVTTASSKGKHVRVEGLDFKRGEVLLAKGHRLTDRDLALAAAMNHPTVSVHRRPKVAVLATGDELIMPGTTPGFGEIVYSNGYATMALARREGCDVVDLGIVPDRLAQTAAGVRRAREVGADILVTSGGASVGDYDLVQEALAAEGLALSFWKVALRPGRPMMHGRLGATHVLGLPGNPVSAYVCAVLFLVPLRPQRCCASTGTGAPRL